jgi:outer membrane protein assembly factor BamB
MPMTGDVRRAVVLTGMVVFLGSAAFAGAAAAQNVGAGEVENIFPLAPRELRQRLARAQSAVAEERFSDAVAEIGEILNAAGSDDFFLGAAGTPDAQLSLKTEALALLGAMPAKGRRMYELQYGSDAKAALESALAAGDLTQLMEVSRRYFHTKAGYEATLLLGRVQLDQGRPLAAALTLKRVAEAPTALAQYDPELSVLLATCWIHANQPAEAEETLVALKKRLPQARVKLGARDVALFQRESGALDWLREIVGAGRTALASAATQWTVYRGDEKRNAQSSGGVPLLNFNWKLPTVNDPADEARVAQQQRSIRDSDNTVICALQPLVVRDYAIVRQPESSKLVGIDLTKNGRRVWVYPPFDENPNTQAAQHAMQTGRGPLANAREGELRQRIWEDHAFGQVSSDGQHVYLLDELSIAPLDGVNIPQVGIGRGGMRFQNPTATKNHNMLMALDLARQGAQVWAVGGTTGDNPALAGAFFLGPPLPVGDQLYVLAELSGEIRLVCLDSRSGGLEWKQQLAVLEANSIAVDKPRRLAGASPSLAEGILICPTSAGATVAIDLATRTLRWGYQYRRNDVVPQFARGGFRTMIPTQSGGRWLDATATIADGCVVLTPPESQQLHCLDLLTGKAKWAPLPRDEMLLVACVYKGKIILVGKNRMKAINLADGKPGWDNDLKLDGETSVGRGYYSDHFYYLPVSGQQLCKIDLDSGTIVSRAQTEAELGNLVCYKDQLISLSPQSVTSFVLMSEHLEKQLGERLAANPNDLEALSLQAQILFQAGKADESLDLLRRASALDAERPATRTLLVKVMLALVRQDFATHGALTDELERLVTDAAQRREVLRWRLEWLVQSERKQEALEAILELADQEIAAAAASGASSVPAPLQNVERERSVRSDRWLQEQLRRLMTNADSATKERIQEQIRSRLERVIAGGNLHELRMFLNVFGTVDAGTAARVSLLEKLIAADALLEAELVAGQLMEHRDRAIAGAAVAALAQIYQKAKRPELAVQMLARLERDFASLSLTGGQTGAEIARRSRGQEALAAQWAKWPMGQIETSSADASASWQQRTALPLELTSYAGAAPRGLRASYDHQKSDIAVRAETGRLLASASLRSAESAPRRNIYGFGNTALTGKANGHLVVLNLGTDIAAVDSLRAERTSDALLWRQDAIDDPNLLNAQRVFSSSRMTRNPLLGNRNNGYESLGRLTFATGPVTASGVVFLRGRQVVCVDPLTGHTLWERSNSASAEIPQQAELFGDEELLFVADGRLESKATEALVLSAIDGSLLGKRTIDTAERRWATFGRNVLAWEEKNALVTLRLYDAWQEGHTVWSKQVANGARGDVVDGEELAILEPNGQFSIVSLASGALRFSVPLDPEPALSWIQVMASRDQYLLLASQEASPGAGGLGPLPVNSGQTQRGMHGRTYAFDQQTGKLQWPAPAFVAQHWLPPDQPTESPLLFFVAMRQGNNKAATAVLALDRRTGQTVYENDLAGAMAANCEIVADLAKRAVVLTLTGQGTRGITFQFTEKPRPPQPPAQLGEMASAAAGRPVGTVDESLGEAIRLLRDRGLPPGAGGVPVPAIPRR